MLFSPRRGATTHHSLGAFSWRGPPRLGLWLLVARLFFFFFLVPCGSPLDCAPVFRGRAPFSQSSRQVIYNVSHIISNAPAGVLGRHRRCRLTSVWSSKGNISSVQQIRKLIARSERRRKTAKLARSSSFRVSLADLSVLPRLPLLRARHCGGLCARTPSIKSRQTARTTQKWTFVCRM